MYKPRFETLLAALALIVPGAGARAATDAFLYEIARGGRASYVFGTVHAGVPLGALDPVVREKMGSATLAVGEMARPDRLTHWKNQFYFRVITRNINQPTLSARLGRGEYRTLARALAKRGYPAAAVDAFSPAGALIALHLGSERDLGELDSEIERDFKSRAVHVVGLETERAVVERVRAGMTFDALRAEIARLAATPEIDRTADSLAAYRAGDRAYFTALEEGDLALAARNREWAPRIEKLADARPGAFFYVGVGHLFGPEGILALLEKRGFTVTPTP